MMQRPPTRLAMRALMVLLAMPVTAAMADVNAYGTPAGNARLGATLGVSLYTGHIGCKTENNDDCGDGVQAAGGLALHGGLMLGPRLALLGEVWGMTHREDGFSTSQVLVTGNLRAWLGQRLWLQAGVGVAQASLRYDSDLVDFESSSDTVPAVGLGLGIELIQSARFGLDLQLRAGRGLYDGDVSLTNVGFGIGASWY